MSKAQLQKVRRQWQFRRAYSRAIGKKEGRTMFYAAFRQ
jgi:hypothetical protein